MEAPIYTRRFQFATHFDCSQQQMFALHEEVAIFRRLIPPWEDITILEMPESLLPGTRAVILQRLGPLRFTWEAVHREYDPPRLFSDEQTRGPFAYWHHRHIVEAAADGCVLRDEIDYRLPLHPLTAGFYPWMERRLRRMFEFRHGVMRELVAERVGEKG